MPCGTNLVLEILIKVQKSYENYWYDVAVGSSEAHIAIDLVNKDGIIVVELYINNNKDLFDSFCNKKYEIESDLGFELVWDKLEGKKAARIKYYIDGLDFDNHSNYQELTNQIIDIAVRMRDVFKKYI
ncbi:MAG: DUF4268 domain-containing protein [Eubacterium sp.]|nr:DUF4268 domain-containing protein [Eubacterium sp.]